MIEKRKTALLNALKDSDAQVRVSATLALDQLEGLADLSQLLSQLSEGDRSSRIAAAYALGKIHSSKVFAPLLKALKSDDPDLRTAAVQVLGEKGHPKTLPHLVQALNDPEPGVVTEIARALGNFNDSRLPKVLASLMKREEQIVLAAIDSMGDTGLAACEEALLEALKDQRPQLRSQAALALGKLQLPD